MNHPRWRPEGAVKLDYSHLDENYFCEHWHFFPQQNLVRRGGVDVPLDPKCSEVLLFLLKNGHRDVSRDEIIQHIWQGRHIGKAVVTVAISHIRKALGDDPKHPCFIRTLSGCGYRFIGQVSRGKSESPAPSIWAGKTFLPVILLFLVMVPGIPREKSPKPRQSLVIHCIENTGADDQHRYWEQGLTQQIRRHLMNSGSFNVLSFDQDQNGTQGPLKGRVLEIRTFRNQANRVKLIVSLRDPDANSVLWIRSFQGSFNELNPMASSVARALRVRVLRPSPDFTQIQRIETLSEAARKLYRQAEYFLHRRYQGPLTRPERLEKAVSGYRETLTEAPGFGPAYTGLAWALLAAKQHHRPKLDLSEIEAVLAKALKINPEDSFALVTRALVQLSYRSDWDGAERYLERALTVTPKSKTAYEFLSLLSLASGYFDASVWYLDKLVETEPLVLPRHTLLSARSLFFKGQPDRAWASLEGLADPPQEGNSFFDFQLLRAQIAGYLGKSEEALHALRLCVAQHPNSKTLVNLMAKAFREGNLSGIYDALYELEVVFPTDALFWDGPFQWASFAAEAGKLEEALCWLEICQSGDSYGRFLIQTDPRFHVLHGDPRFSSTVGHVL